MSVVSLFSRFIPDTLTGMNLTASPNRALGALFLAAFVVGSAELVVVGVLTLVADDLGVPIGTAGVLVSSYALGIAIGGPLLTSLTINRPRRSLLRLAFGVYVLGNLLAAASASFGLLVLARVVTGALHGMFIGVAFGVAAALVPPARMGRAIAMVLGGIAVSTAFGVPLGTLIGQAFGWQATFLSIVVLGVLALLVLVLLVPPTEKAGSADLRSQARYALAPRVLLVLAAGFFVLGGQFAALTYLTPFLEEVTGIAAGAVALFLLAYGLAAAAGTLLGGWAADRDANITLVAGTCVVVASLVLIYVGSTSPVLVIVGLLVWGAAGWGLVPSLQYRTVSLAGPGRDLAATLPASVLAGGIAFGALLGGWAIASFGPAAPVLAAAIACAAVVPLLVVTTTLRAPATTAATDTDRAPAEQR